MIRPNYRDFRRSTFAVVNGQYLSHSAKGSTWKEHKYIKRIDGTYYYPDSYEDGRHLPKKKEEAGGGGSEEKLEDWEKTLYEDIDNTLKRNPGLFDPKNITNDEEFQDFKLTLGEFAGIDADELSSEEIERMRKKVYDHYNKEEKSDELLLEEIEKKGEKSDEKETEDLSENDVEKLAKEVIRGNFGNGQQRKDLLGENYDKIQKRVNEILRGSSGSKKVSKASKASVRKVEEAAKRVDEAKKRLSYTKRF